LNYLAHIHLAHITQTSLLGNFMGDFVKGSDLGRLPTSLEQGVRLHRAIDTFTDQHTLVRDLKRAFPTNIRRMSGVVIDIYFDHLLCCYWQQYSDTPLNSMLATFYTALAETDVSLDGRFNDVKDGLLTYRWLHEYSQTEAVHRAFYQIEKRLGQRITFAELAIKFISQNKTEFDDVFVAFYPKLIEYCHSHSEQLS
jgi:acyl carrier protein phosphodiesterase